MEVLGQQQPEDEEDMIDETDEVSERVDLISEALEQANVPLNLSTAIGLHALAVLISVRHGVTKEQLARIHTNIAEGMKGEP